MLRQDVSENNAARAAHGRRYEKNFTIEFPIEVSGFDSSGRFQSEATSTRNVAASSCNFHLRMEVEKGMVLAIRVVSGSPARLADLSTVLFYVARVDRIPGGFSVGAVTLAPRAPWSAEVMAAKSRQGYLF
ncbi:MAG TPA: hypothetical protein VJR23_03565 [Candidatus Acidoferrales bacterium]|nr:hypothetical protein [Candidatus Acidoferrales bacterium]